MVPGKQEAKIKPLPSIKRSVIWASGFYIWDVLVYGMPVIGLVFSFLAFVFYGLFAMVRKAKQERELARRYAWRGLIYLITVAAILGSHNLNLKLGAANAERIIAAVEGFYNEENRFPKTLEELVPVYLERVPRAAVRFNANTYRYWNEGDRYQLLWVKVPPYLRAVYDFSTKEWLVFD